MRYLKNYRLLAIVLIAGFLGLTIYLSINKNVASKPSTLTVSIAGEKKYLNIKSDVDGDLGTFYVGNIDLKLSKQKHLLEISGETFQTEVVTVDFTKSNNLSLKLDLSPKTNAQNTVIQDYENLQGIKVSDCVYYANKAWMSCFTGDGDTKENNIYKLDNNKWTYVISGTWITKSSLEGTGAPEELLRTLEN